MVEETATGEEGVKEEAGERKLGVHIYLTAEGYDRVVKCADYAALEGIIKGHPRGNFSQYCNFCLNLGEDYLRTHALEKRGYK